MTTAEAVEYLQTKIPPDEPVFVLRGRDSLAPLVIDLWANVLEVVVLTGHEADKREARIAKVQHARALSHRMRYSVDGRLPD